MQASFLAYLPKIAVCVAMFYAIVRAEVALLGWLLIKIANLSTSMCVGGIGMVQNHEFLSLSSARLVFRVLENSTSDLRGLTYTILSSRIAKLTFLKALLIV